MAAWDSASFRARFHFEKGQRRAGFAIAHLWDSLPHIFVGLDGKEWVGAIAPGAGQPASSHFSKVLARTPATGRELSSRVTAELVVVDRTVTLRIGGETRLEFQVPDLITTSPPSIGLVWFYGTATVTVDRIHIAPE